MKAVRIALVGCGGMAHWHAEQMKKVSELEVVALADPNQENLRKLADKYFPSAQKFENFDALLRSIDELDAVLFATPHTLHFDQARAALERDLHVLVEKPMVTSSDHAYELWQTVKRTGKLLGITFQSPYTAEFAYLAKERDAGRLGRPMLLTGWLSQSWMVGTRGSWRQDPALSGGGQMYDSGAHLLNAFMWLMNEPVVEAGCFYDKLGSPVDINGVAIVKFASGALGSITIGGHCPAYRTEIAIQTDTMLIVTDQYGGKLELHGPGGKKLYPHVEPLSEGGGTPHHNFVNAILGREPLRAPIRYGVLLSTLMDALYESADTGKIVHVKPVPAEI
jgi:predicted dehydrogenase